MFDPRNLSPAERELYLHGVRNGLEYARKYPESAQEAVEIADLELILVK